MGEARRARLAALAAGQQLRPVPPTGSCWCLYPEPEWKDAMHALEHTLCRPGGCDRLLCDHEEGG